MRDPCAQQLQIIITVLGNSMGMRVVNRCGLLAALWLLAAPTLAQESDVHVYLCVGPDGQKTYTNKATSRSCKRLDLHPVVSIPAPKPKSSGAASARPAHFPSVSSNMQRERDLERRKILEDELRLETEKLAQLQAEYNNGEPERLCSERNYARYQERVARLKEDIQRAQANMNSLNRELSLLNR